MWLFLQRERFLVAVGNTNLLQTLQNQPGVSLLFTRTCAAGGGGALASRAHCDPEAWVPAVLAVWLPMLHLLGAWRLVPLAELSPATLAGNQALSSFLREAVSEEAARDGNQCLSALHKEAVAERPDDDAALDGNQAPPPLTEVAADEDVARGGNHAFPSWTMLANRPSEVFCLAPIQ